MENWEDEMAEIERGYERQLNNVEKFAEDITKYFDRINDKLFSLNNIYIGAYLALVAFKPNVPKVILGIPLANSILMIYIDYLMMESRRRMSKIMDMKLDQIKKENDRLNTINLISFSPIVTTLFVTSALFVFVYYYL